MKKSRFTDMMDATMTISLFEYGIIRNPETGKTIVCMNPCDDVHTMDNKPIIKTTHIYFDEVREYLEEVSGGYFDFIGSTRKAELKNLDNDYLALTIFSLNQWDGFLNNMSY